MLTLSYLLNAAPDLGTKWLRVAGGPWGGRLPLLQLWSRMGNCGWGAQGGSGVWVQVRPLRVHLLYHTLHRLPCLL